MKNLLVVSFGTTHRDTREKTIERIEKRLRGVFSEYNFTKAFTSSMIRKILWERDGEKIPSVEEALAEIETKESVEVLIQPTHIIPGEEYEKVIKAAEASRLKTRVGKPLLFEVSDFKHLAKILENAYRVNGPQEAILLMGHGSDHYANLTYPALENYLKKLSPHYFVSTVEGEPSLDETIRELKSGGYRKIKLVPLMIVAGEHVKNDMEKYWKKRLEEEGFVVECYPQGLGELEEIREMYVEHARKA